MNISHIHKCLQHQTLLGSVRYHSKVTRIALEKTFTMKKQSLQAIPRLGSFLWFLSI